MKEENRFSANQLSESIRFDVWRHVVRQQVGYDLRPRGAAQSFDSAVEFKRSPLLSIARMSCDIGTAVRHEREISDRYTGSFIMYREDAPATNFVLRGNETLVRRGEWVIGNYDLPHTAQSATSFNYEVARFPREFILPHLPVLARGRFLKLTGRPGAEALAISYFYEIRRNWESLDEREIAEAADTLARLIGIAGGARPDEHTDAVRFGRLARLKHYIDRHLDDPALSPETAALAERIALRTAQACFEPTGESFSAYVRRRRLEKCRDALTADATRSVAQIAFDGGFASLATFNRAFRAGFGASPTDVRAAAQAKGRD